ncbi:MAG: MBG domain-containing protein, partial [Verrucomicrobiota bacterium]|nr:MBG domain-containing protein [Verrucomicrobiota bacterium]
TFVPGTFTITKRTLTVTAENKSKVYGEANPTFTATITGFVNGENASVLTSPVVLSSVATAASSVGNYSIVPSGAAAQNYNINFVSGTLAVTKRPLTIKADDKTKTFGSALPTLTATFNGFVNGDTSASLNPSVQLSTPATALSPVGTYPIVPSAAGSSNYSIQFESGTLTVTAASQVFRIDSANLRLTSGRFEMDVIAPAGSRVRLESSDALPGWTEVETKTVAMGEESVTFIVEVEGSQFYRAVIVP